MGRRIPLVVVVCLAVIFASATWIRNERVSACGVTAKRILDGVSIAAVRSGSVLAFADVPNGQVQPPYGFYRFDGLRTIANRTQTMECAMQLLLRNQTIHARILDSVALNEVEAGHAPVRYDRLIVVSADGTFSEKILTASAYNRFHDQHLGRNAGSTGIKAAYRGGSGPRQQQHN